MTLKGYYNNHINPTTATPEDEWNVIADYLSSYSMQTKEDIVFMHECGFMARDFIDFECENIYTQNDLYLLIDNYYDAFFLADLEDREYSKEAVTRLLNIANQECERHELTNILKEYAD